MDSFTLNQQDELKLGVFSSKTLQEKELMEEAKKYPELPLNQQQLCDIELILNGGFYPLKGFLNEIDYQSVLENCRLHSKEIWPIPIVLSIPKNEIKPYRKAKNITLIHPLYRNPLALLEVDSIYNPNVRKECECIYGSTDENHPSIKRIMNQDSYYIGGKLKKICLPTHFDFKDLRLSPYDLISFFQKNNWKTIIGFQTRNPIHAAHLQLTLNAAEKIRSDNNAKILIHPAIGMTQPKDIAFPIRVQCYKKILKHYPLNKVKLALLPLAMRMAGPREALWHSLIRQNYGCTHFIIGRDHAGPSAKTQSGDSFYAPYAAQDFVKKFSSELKIKIISSPEIVYDEKLKTYIPIDPSLKEPPKSPISGSYLRKALHEDLPVPKWVSFPEVLGVLKKSFMFEKGFCIYLVGLSGAGKTTIAHVLMEKLQELDKFSRKITLLDGDEIRKNLSSGLGFSKKDRSLNVQRIGYVASLIVKHGGICLCSNIAPYEGDRLANRQCISKHGLYLEVFVNTPLQTCELRDVKGLYKKARVNEIPNFTAISDPYEPPKNADIIVEGVGDIEKITDKILSHIKNLGYL